MSRPCPDSTRRRDASHSRYGLRTLHTRPACRNNIGFPWSRPQSHAPPQIQPCAPRRHHLPPCIARWLRAMRRPHPPSRLTDLQSVRTAMLQAVDDCVGPPAQRLQLKIHRAHTHRELWQLRSDAYHLIALSHCQSIADERIHRLLHLFENRMAPQELSRTP